MVDVRERYIVFVHPVIAVTQYMSRPQVSAIGRRMVNRSERLGLCGCECSINKNKE